MDSEKEYLRGPEERARLPAGNAGSAQTNMR